MCDERVSQATGSARHSKRKREEERREKKTVKMENTKTYMVYM